MVLARARGHAGTPSAAAFGHCSGDRGHSTSQVKVSWPKFAFAPAIHSFWSSIALERKSTVSVFRRYLHRQHLHLLHPFFYLHAHRLHPYTLALLVRAVAVGQGCGGRWWDDRPRVVNIYNSFLVKWKESMDMQDLGPRHPTSTRPRRHYHHMSTPPRKKRKTKSNKAWGAQSKPTEEAVSLSNGLSYRPRPGVVRSLSASCVSAFVSDLHRILVPSLDKGGADFKARRWVEAPRLPDHLADLVWAALENTGSGLISTQILSSVGAVAIR